MPSSVDCITNTSDGEVRDPQVHQSDRGTPRDQAEPDGNDSLYRFNFLTQRGDPSPRDDVAKDVRAADSRQAHAGTLYRGGLPLLARPRTEGVDSRTVRRVVISRYFPEFERELPRYLSRS